LNATDLLLTVMAGPVPGIHASLHVPVHVDGRDKPGHDEEAKAAHLTKAL